MKYFSKSFFPDVAIFLLSVVFAAPLLGFIDSALRDSFSPKLLALVFPICIVAIIASVSLIRSVESATLNRHALALDLLILLALTFRLARYFGAEGEISPFWILEDGYPSTALHLVWIFGIAYVFADLTVNTLNILKGK